MKTQGARIPYDHALNNATRGTYFYGRSANNFRELLLTFRNVKTPIVTTRTQNKLTYEQMIVIQRLLLGPTMKLFS